MYHGMAVSPEEIGDSVQELIDSGFHLPTDSDIKPKFLAYTPGERGEAIEESGEEEKENRPLVRRAGEENALQIAPSSENLPSPNLPPAKPPPTKRPVAEKAAELAELREEIAKRQPVDAAATADRQVPLPPCAGSRAAPEEAEPVPPAKVTKPKAQPKAQQPKRKANAATAPKPAAAPKAKRAKASAKAAPAREGSKRAAAQPTEQPAVQPAAQPAAQPQVLVASRCLPHTCTPSRSSVVSLLSLLPVAVPSPPHPHPSLQIKCGYIQHESGGVNLRKHAQDTDDSKRHFVRGGDFDSGSFVKILEETTAPNGTEYLKVRRGLIVGYVKKAYIVPRTAEETEDLSDASEVSGAMLVAPTPRCPHTRPHCNLLLRVECDTCSTDDCADLLQLCCAAGDDEEEPEEVSEEESETEEEEVFMVEKILSHRGSGKTREYYVKWEGWEDPTWEAAGNLTSFENTELTEYLKGLKGSA